MGAKVGGGGDSRFNIGMNSDLNVTPFVDVMLVLLIIFMVVAPLATVTIPVDLPPAVETPEPPKEKPVYISLGEYDVLLVDAGSGEVQVPVPELGDALFTRFGVGKTRKIFFRADDPVKYRAIMNVFNVLQNSGYFEVNLVAEAVSS